MDENRVGPISRTTRFPIAAKLALLLLAASLIPLGVASWWTMRRGLQSVEHTALRNLQLIASVTATRIDQLIVDTQRVQKLFALDDAVVSLCSATPAQREPFISVVERELGHLIKTNPDLASAFVVGADGVGLVSTNPRNVGQDLTFRQYVQQALAGEDYISEILVGQTTAEPGIYFAGPVHAPDGTVIGACVVKLRGETIYRMCDQAAIDGEGGYAAITDHDGILISHPRREWIYQSLTTLSEEDLRRIDPKTRFGLDTIHSMGMDELADELSRAHTAGSASFYSPTQQETMIVGYSPMSERRWIVSVVQPRSEFAAPLRQLRAEQLFSVGVVGIAAVLLGLVAARRLVRPVRDLIFAADRVAGGDWSARAPVTTYDEIGALARTFNAMVPELQERAKMEDALRLAREIQKHLLPQSAPKIPGLDVAGVNIPADQTGGDYYDFLDLSAWRRGTLAVAVGDVTGHGVAAALLMATGRALLRGRATPPGELTELMSQVNIRLHEDVPDGRFMTLIYALIDRPGRGVALVSAGHDPILLFDPAEGSFLELNGDDIPLGIEADWHFTQKSWDNIPAGAVLLIGTDGIWETRSPSGEMFGKDRLRELIRAHADEPVHRIIAHITAALSEFRADGPQQDDVTVVIIRFVPEDR